MKTAKELMLNYLKNVSDADKVSELFADDAVIELPYLASVGLPYRWEGKEVIRKFFQNLPDTFSGFHFINIQIHIDTPNQAFGEYGVEAMVKATGKPYNQHYMGRLQAENGKIKLLREAMNMVPVIKGMFPNTLPEL